MTPTQARKPSAPTEQLYCLSPFLCVQQRLTSPFHYISNPHTAQEGGSAHTVPSFSSQLGLSWESITRPSQTTRPPGRHGPQAALALGDDHVFAQPGCTCGCGTPRGSPANTGPSHLRHTGMSLAGSQIVSMAPPVCEFTVGVSCLPCSWIGHRALLATNWHPFAQCTNG